MARTHFLSGNSSTQTRKWKLEDENICCDTYSISKLNLKLTSHARIRQNLSCKPLTINYSESTRSIFSPHSILDLIVAHADAKNSNNPLAHVLFSWNTFWMCRFGSLSDFRFFFFRSNFPSIFDLIPIDHHIGLTSSHCDSFKIGSIHFGVDDFELIYTWSSSRSWIHNYKILKGIIETNIMAGVFGAIEFARKILHSTVGWLFG